MHNFFKKFFGKNPDTQEIATFAHQLRAPLTAIKWVFENLQKSKLDNEQVELMRTGIQTSEHVSQLVDDFLNLSKIESGAFDYHFEKVNLVTFLEISLNDAFPVAKAYAVELGFDHPEEIEINTTADPRKLGIVVSNLLDNAIKYNNPGGNVTVKIEKLEKENKALITVKDTGIGIPEEAKEKLFSKFYRAENAVQRKTKGSGFGLYIVKEIIEKFGGKIWMESTLGKGTTLYFTLPLMK